MNRRALSSAALLLLIGGCQGEGSMSSRSKNGRYQGIGVATPGAGWTTAADAPKPGKSDAATLSDDDYVVFITDTQTGEVRECGDRSGFCIKLQPWAKPTPQAPISLTEHKKIADDDALVGNVIDAPEESLDQP